MCRTSGYRLALVTLLPTLAAALSTPARASCVRPPHCPCTWHSGSAYLPARATVTLVEAGRLQATLDEWLVEGSSERTDGVGLGVEVGGAWSGKLPCGDQPADVAAGDAVLLLYRRGDADRSGCAEYRRCSLDRCGDGPTGDGAEWDRCDSECLSETSEVCDTHLEEALLGGEVVVVPWADPLVLGSGPNGRVTLGLADIDVFVRRITYRRLCEVAPGDAAGHRHGLGGAISSRRC